MKKAALQKTRVVAVPGGCATEDKGSVLATVRIYKVAELLGTTSQEVTALLKRDHGIEVKSASSTIEEVVARQFVDRLSKQRNIQLPGGNIFAETPAAKGKKPAPAKKAPDPVKPTAPTPPLPTSAPPRAVQRPIAPPKPAVSAAARPAAGTASAGATAARPPMPGTGRPGGAPGQRPPFPGPRPQGPVGGPRPLPS